MHASEQTNAVAFQCPNCGAPLTFSPEKEKFACDFCLSDFTEADLASTDAAEKAKQTQADAEEFCAHMNTYACPSCGGEIMADEHTVADFCAYCHSPVVLQGKLVGQMQPSKMVPFKIDEKGAKETFLKFAKRKWFAPKDFSTPTQIENMKGIYYPFWITDADTDAQLSARATRVRSWRSGNRIYTETSHFAVERSGEIHFEDITTSALKEADKKMLEGILPFASEDLRQFSPEYLSGFLAKKRNVERADLRDEVRNRMEQYATEMLRNTIQGYSTVDVTDLHLHIQKSHWEYALLPLWLLVYRGKRKDYTFALNGATGKIYGNVPVSFGRLAVFGGALLVLVSLIVYFFGGIAG